LGGAAGGKLWLVEAKGLPCEGCADEVLLKLKLDASGGAEAFRAQGLLSAGGAPAPKGLEKLWAAVVLEGEEALEVEPGRPLSGLMLKTNKA
jgi:hypothetical protein